MRIAAKRARSATSDAATSSDSDASADSEPQDAQAAAVTMDEAGLLGPGVQVPSPAVWQLLTHAVRVDGARHVSELINAMGGPLRGASDDCTLSEMSLECYLSMLMPPPREVVVGDAVRVLCGDNPLPAWRSGTITMVGAGIVMAKVDGVSAPMRFDRVDWRYLAAPSPPAAAPPPAPRQRTSREPLSLTSPGPDDYGRKRAAELRRMSCRAEAVAVITKHIAYGAGVGNRLARRAVLAIHARQTPDEQREECTKHRNAAGWSKIDAPRGGELARRIRAGDALRPSDAAACRKLAMDYAAQLLDSEHLAAVLGRADEDDAMSDAHDSSTESGDDEEDCGGDCDDFLAPEDVETEPTMGTVFARSPEGRLMNPRVYALFEAMLQTHGGDTSKAAADMLTAFPTLHAYDMHIALAQRGALVAKAGDRVRVPYPEERAFYDGVVTKAAARYAFVQYTDGDAVPMDEMQLVWHYVV